MIVIILSCMLSDENDKKTGLEQNECPVVSVIAVVFFLSPRRLDNYYFKLLNLLN